MSILTSPISSIQAPLVGSDGMPRSGSPGWATIGRIADRSMVWTPPPARAGLLAGIRPPLRQPAPGLLVGDDDGGLGAALGRHVGERRALVHRQRRHAGTG